MLSKLQNKDILSVIRGLLYTALGISFLYLLITGQYKLYIAPRYQLFLLLTGITLLVGGIISILWSPNKQYKHNWKSITPIIIPLVLLIVPPILSPDSVQVTGNTAVTDDRNDFDFSQDDIGDVITVNNTAKDPGISKDKKEIVLNSDNYYRTIVTLGSNPEAYVGYKIYMTGYVNRDDNTLKSNEFTLSRMSMACCIADVSPIGLTMHKADGDSYNNKKWITVEGTVSTRDFHGRKQPYIEINKTKDAQEILGYVYP